MPAVAHAAHIWIARHLPKPFLVPLGTVSRRGKTGSSVVSDRLALRTSLFFCATCEQKMPYRWSKRWEYAKIPGFHGEQVRCDSCQEVGSADIWHPEEGGYYQEYRRVTAFEVAVQAQSAARAAGRRIPAR
jgi:hypothetical protein